MHHRTERARTLMRGGLKKPGGQKGPTVSRGHNTNPQRELRAKTVSRHQGVQRFGIPSPRPKPVPAGKAVTGELVQNRSMKSASQPSVAAPLPSMVTSVSHQKLERMLDQALTHADTHMEAMRYQAARHFWHRRWFGGRRKWAVIVVIVAVVIAALAVCYQKVPALSVKAAGLRAHMSATVPTYIPDGYKMAGPAKADSGTVVVEYISNAAGSRSYQIIQAQSNLTSLLVEQSVVPKGAAVQTSQVEGNTVYIYGKDNDAAWVNNGVLYTIKDQANLSSDELIKIVQGLNP